MWRVCQFRECKAQARVDGRRVGVEPSAPGPDGARLALLAAAVTPSLLLLYPLTLTHSKIRVSNRCKAEFQTAAELVTVREINLT